MNREQLTAVTNAALHLANCLEQAGETGTQAHQHATQIFREYQIRQNAELSKEKLVYDWPDRFETRSSG